MNERPKKLMACQPDLVAKVFFKTADEFVHATNADNIEKILQSGAVRPLDKIEGQVNVEPKLLGRGRALMDAGEAKKVMEGVKNTDRVFLSRGGVVPSYGDYMIVKDLTHPKEHDRLNLIPNEYTTRRSLSVRNNATIFVPDNEVDRLSKKYKGVKIKPRSEFHLPELGLWDGAKTLARKLRFLVGLDVPQRAGEKTAGIPGYLWAGLRRDINSMWDNTPALKGYSKRYQRANGRRANRLYALQDDLEFFPERITPEQLVPQTLRVDRLKVRLNNNDHIGDMAYKAYDRMYHDSQRIRLAAGLGLTAGVGGGAYLALRGAPEEKVASALDYLVPAGIAAPQRAGEKTAAAPSSRAAYIWAALKGDRGALLAQLNMSPDRVAGVRERIMQRAAARRERAMRRPVSIDANGSCSPYTQVIERTYGSGMRGNGRVTTSVAKATRAADTAVVGARVAAAALPVIGAGAYWATRSSTEKGASALDYLVPAGIAAGVGGALYYAHRQSKALADQLNAAQQPEAPGIAALGNIKKTISRNAMPVGSTELGLATDSSDVDILVPYKREHHWRKAIERIQAKYPELRVGEYSANKPDKRVLTGPINGQNVDIVLAHGPKPLAFAQRFNQLKEELTPEQRQAIVNRKRELKNSWILPETRYKQYKKDVAHQLGLAPLYF